MNRLDSIPVNAVPHGAVKHADGNARAILQQIAQMLETLLTTGETGSIDLHALPLSPADRTFLSESLGTGEVQAEVEALGKSRAVETGISGVWWIVHHNADGDVIGEFVEVAFCPEILLTPVEDVRDGLDALRARLFVAGRNLAGHGEDHE